MNKQILEVVSAVSIEKDVDKEIIFEALEEAISSATKKLIGEIIKSTQENYREPFNYMNPMGFPLHLNKSYSQYLSHQKFSFKNESFYMRC